MIFRRRSVVGYRVYIKNKKTKAHQPGWWPESKKVEVLTTYLTTRSQALTESITGVPRRTIINWMKQPWWKEHTEEIQQQEHIELDKKLVKVMDKALDAVVDRLENGEFVYDEKTGRVVRVPAKLRDTNKVLTDMIDKRELLKKVSRNTQAQEKKELTVDHLVQLAEAFASFTGKKKPMEEISVIEGEVIIDGLQDKREGQESS